MKFGLLIEYNKINFFFKNPAENEAGKIVPAFFLFSEKVLYEISLQLVVCSLVSISLDSPQIGIEQKQIVKNFRLLIQRYAQF